MTGPAVAGGASARLERLLVAAAGAIFALSATSVVSWAQSTVPPRLPTIDPAVRPAIEQKPVIKVQPPNTFAMQLEAPALVLYSGERTVQIEAPALILYSDKTKVRR